MFTKKIDELTDDQVLAIEDYTIKYTKYGLSTTQVTDEAWQDCVSSIYRDLLEIEVPKIEVYSGPLQCWERVCDGEKIPFYYPFIDGNFNAALIANYIYYAEVLGVPIDEEMKLYQRLFSTHLVFPLDDVAVCCQRPIRLCVDEQFNLHSEDGPSVEYKDDLTMFAIHGVEVPEEVVMNPKDQDISDLDNEENNDIRTVRINRYGWDRYIKEKGLLSIDERLNTRTNSYEALYDIDGIKTLIANCGTGNIVPIRVGDVNTCAEAEDYLCNVGDRKVSIIKRT